MVLQVRDTILMSTSNNRDNFEQSQLRLYSQELLIVKISLNNTLKK